jgi:hypothetical protein
VAWKFTLVNPEEVPPDLPPGHYKTRIVSASWCAGGGHLVEVRVAYVPYGTPEDCLFKLVKADGSPDMDVIAGPIGCPDDAAAS